MKGLMKYEIEQIYKLFCDTELEMLFENNITIAKSLFHLLLQRKQCWNKNSRTISCKMNWWMLKQKA